MTTSAANTSTLLPGACVGVVGGGQLGRYFVLAARQLGYRTVVLDPDAAAPAMQLGATTLVAAYDDAGALEEMATLCDAVTLEFENVPAATLETLAERLPVSPYASHVSIAQDRLREKRLAEENGLATAPWCPIETAADIDGVDASLFPAILKTARLGYDGKGQAPVSDRNELHDAWAATGAVASVLEARLDLVAELSVIVARGTDGQSVLYPPASNVHRDGVLHTSTVPCALDAWLIEEALASTRALADALEYVGVLALEFFITRTDTGRLELRFNEMAPRPHNSGHWTIDACETSQFEQQLRALVGLPLGGVRLLTPVCMLNLLGTRALTTRVAAALVEPGATLHLYGKHEAREGRKMGHVNCLAETHERALSIATNIQQAG